jgi:hypothetical protein
MLPPCPDGIRPTRETRCALPFAAGPVPGQPKPGEPGTDCRPACAAPPAGGPGTPGPGGDRAGEHGPPPLMGGFLSRVWRLTAEVDSYDASSNTLNVTVSKILNLSKRFKAQDDDIVDQDADVVFTKSTKVFDADGKRLRSESGYGVALDAAGSVAVTGKIAPQSKWNKDEDGSPVTTLRAKRVKITG